MTVSPLVKVLVIMNNYFHDVATAMLFSSALIVWILGRMALAEGPSGREWFVRAYQVLTRVAVFSIVWIVVGGVPRTIFFNEVEWNLADPSNRYLFSALMLKHATMWLLVVLGAVMWARLRRYVRTGDAG